MNRREILGSVTAAALVGAAGRARAAEPLKVGLILPMTGAFASTGRQIEAACRLYLKENGADVAGRPVELILRDDAGAAETTKRLAQELIVRERIAVMAGFGLTPLALAAAPLATQAKVPAVVMAAATSSITEASPFVVRSGFTLPQVTAPLAGWAQENGVRKVVTLVADYGPGIDAEKTFVERLGKGGGTTESVRVPLRDPDFAPFLQRAADAKPDALFVFVPSGAGAQFMKQFVERGLDKSGIRLICTGDVVDDDLLPNMGDAALGVVSTHHYSAAHDSAKAKAYLAAFKAATGTRPNFMSVGGYDGMHLICEAAKATNGGSGEALVSAMKGMRWESPRGPMAIDPATRDVVQNVYVRKVERRDGELWNVEFATVPDVKDPVKAAKAG